MALLTVSLLSHFQVSLLHVFLLKFLFFKILFVKVSVVIQTPIFCFIFSVALEN